MLSVSNGLAAAPPSRPMREATPRVAVATAPAEAKVEVVAAALAAATVADTTKPETATDALVTPDALARLVFVRQAHPRPLRPQTECVARTVYREASNQALAGQLAVAQVIVNRTHDGAFPKTACGVIGQPGQFSEAPLVAAETASRPWRTAVAIAGIAQDSHIAQVAPGALFFHAAYVRPSWSRSRQRIAQIGDHIFYR